LIRKNPSQQSIDDKELIVDKFVLINKKPSTTCSVGATSRSRALRTFKNSD
jgi:hypothetical protein